MSADGSVVAEKYRLVERIGEGGMGTVWRAECLDEAGDDGAPREVALKVVRLDVVSERSRSRFHREAEHAASIHHDNVVEVLDHGVHEDHPYIAMELLEGQSLDARLVELPPPSVGDLIRWTCQALAGLGAVHARGIIHRDLKPANLFLERDPRVADGQHTLKVLDFGLSRSLGGAEGAAAVSLTQTHQFLGTPYYVSPEQVRSAKHIDERADLYSIGVILYEAIAGRRPFDGPNAAAVIAAVVADTPRSLAAVRPDLPAALCEAVERAMARSPDARFQTANEMAVELAGYLDGGDLDRVLATPRAGELAPLSGSSVPPVGSDTQRTDPTSGSTRASGATRRSRPSRLPNASPGSLAPPHSRLLIGLLAAFAFVGIGAAGMAGWLADTPPPVEPLPVPSDAPPPEVFLDGVYAFGSLGTLGEAAHVMWWLPEDVRARVVVTEDAGGWRLVTDGPIRGERARVLQEEGEVDLAPWDGTVRAGLRPRLVVTTASLNVRDEPMASGPFVRTLPRGTITVALTGQVGETRSELGGRGTWAYVSPSARTVGWSAAAFLHPYAGCLPTERALPRSEGATLSRVRLLRNARGFDAMLVLDAHEGRSDLALYRMNADCALQLEREIQVGGRVQDVLLPTTADAGGDTLLVIAWSHAALGEGREVWNAYRLDEAEPVWETRLRSSQRLRSGRVSVATGVRRGPNDESGYWPLRIRYVDGRRVYYQWDGTTLNALP